MSRGCFRNFGCNIFGVPRSVWNFHFEASRCCIVSLRDVELRTRSCCPEVALDIVSVTFSVSRDRFNNFHFEVSRGWTVNHSKRMSGSARCLQPLGPPLPGLDRGDPKTAQIGPGPSQTQKPSEMIILLIEITTVSGGFPN